MMYASLAALQRMPRPVRWALAALLARGAGDGDPEPSGTAGEEAASEDDDRGYGSS